MVVGKSCKENSMTNYLFTYRDMTNKWCEFRVCAADEVAAWSEFYSEVGFDPDDVDVIETEEE